MENVAKKITIFLAHGLPKGIREIAIDQWSGLAICGPRNKIKEILTYPELKGPCLYFLIGEPEEGEFLNVYVGEADPFTERVGDHLRKKDWWQQVVVFAGNKHNPNKTGIQYLESICVARLKDAAKCTLDNGNNPALPSIPKEDIPGLENFYNNIELVMPLLGFDIFASSKAQIASEKTLERIYCTGGGTKAEAILQDDGKVKVFAGSIAKKENAPSFEKHNYKKLKDELLKINRLVVQGEHLIFTDDYVFDSLSAAAAVILSRSAQGPKEWVNSKGKALKDLA